MATFRFNSVRAGRGLAIIVASLRGVLVGALALGLAGACAVIDSVDPRYDHIDRASARARNEAILLNIVRASHSVPLNFIAFSKVSGTHAVAMGAGAPQFGLGPEPLVITVNRQVLFGSSTLNGGTSANNSFDISLLESKDFYNGLLSPVDLPTLNFFVRQGYLRELLFWLFTESVRETAGGRTREYRNDPDPNIACDDHGGRRRCFSDVVDLAIASGLTVQIQTQKVKGTIYGRLCFDTVLAERAKRFYPPEIFLSATPAANLHPRCNIDPWPHEIANAVQTGETDTLTFEVRGTRAGPTRYEITTRSTFGIYQFLGRILHTGATERIRLRGHLDANEDPRLLAVEPTSAEGCFVDLAFDGAYYCVPRRGAENTKRIFSLLAQLLALKTQPGDLAITPTVRTIQ